MKARAATGLLAWSLVALAAMLLLGGVALSWAPGVAVGGPASGVEIADSSAGVDLIVLLTFSGVGAIVASRHPRNAIGWLFCGVGVTIGLNSFAGDYAEFWLASGFGPDALGETAAWFSSWGWRILVYVPTGFLLLLFPDGRLPSPRWRVVVWGAALGAAGGVAGSALEAGPLVDFPTIPNPYGVDSPGVVAAEFAGSIMAAGSMVAAAVSLLVRRRRAGRAERQQIKWLAYGGAVVVAGILAGAVIALWSVPASIAVSSVALLGLPVFTGIAIVRHHLYDIDLLINRTLVYGSLTVTLALLYFGVVVVLQRTFVALTDERSTLAVVASTLLIAALFNPARRRIQSFIDRGFYRRRYDARRTLEAFSSRLRDETDLAALNESLVSVVRETMQPEHAGVWLRTPAGTRERRRAPSG